MDVCMCVYIRMAKCSEFRFIPKQVFGFKTSSPCFSASNVKKIGTVDGKKVWVLDGERKKDNHSVGMMRMIMKSQLKSPVSMSTVSFAHKIRSDSLCQRSFRQQQQVETELTQRERDKESLLNFINGCTILSNQPAAVPSTHESSSHPFQSTPKSVPRRLQRTTAEYFTPIFFKASMKMRMMMVSLLLFLRAIHYFLSRRYSHVL